MDGADILGILALALGGGAGAYVIWYLVRFGPGDGPSEALTAPGQAAAPARVRARGRPAAPDPALMAEIAALRTEIAAIAATQARMMHGQADHEGMLLGEMRAIASAMDPKIVESLARIESSLGTSGHPAAAPEPDGAAEETPVDGSETRPADSHEFGSEDDLATDAGGGDATAPGDATAAGGDRSDDEGQAAADGRRDDAAAAREGEKLYVVPDAREDKPEKGTSPARTIRRG